jgi:hypothetical protein
MQPVDWLTRMRSLTHSTDCPMVTTPSRKHLPHRMPVKTYLMHPPSGRTHADVVASQCVTATLPPKASGLLSLSPCVGGTAQKWELGTAGEGSVRLASLPDWGCACARDPPLCPRAAHTCAQNAALGIRRGHEVSVSIPTGRSPNWPHGKVRLWLLNCKRGCAWALVLHAGLNPPFVSASIPL